MIHFRKQLLHLRFLHSLERRAVQRRLEGLCDRLAIVIRDTRLMPHSHSSFRSRAPTCCRARSISLRMPERLMPNSFAMAASVMPS